MTALPVVSSWLRVRRVRGSSLLNGGKAPPALRLSQQVQCRRSWTPLVSEPQRLADRQSSGRLSHIRVSLTSVQASGVRDVVQGSGRAAQTGSGRWRPDQLAAACQGNLTEELPAVETSSPAQNVKIITLRHQPKNHVSTVLFCRGRKCSGGHLD